ncbi:thiamine pyrophosphate-dependent enzyme, partial [candidate division CSSED10-310 bacterium]
MSPKPRSNQPDPLLVDVEGHVESLLGNEAIVRGALESGVAFASGYPGTPSSEVTDSFARIAAQSGIHFEYSVNEKVALEMAFAASLAGSRSICAMKHLGLMSAGDPLSTIPYVGTVGGMVVVSAGDPSCLTSPNEQDQRHLSRMLQLPMFDPCTPRDAYDMTRFAFELSEACCLPVIMRITTRICHSRGLITYGRLLAPRTGSFKRDPQRFVPIPTNARRLRIELKERINTASELIDKSDFFRIEGQGKIVVLASGAPAATCADIIRESNLSSRVLLMTSQIIYPLPVTKLMAELRRAEQVLVVEELSPFLEDTVRALCQQFQINCEIYGKRTAHFPEEFEYEPEVIKRGLGKFLGVDLLPEQISADYPVPPRPPILCPGCPHRSTYFAARMAFGDEYLYFNDIGCYTLGYGPPLNTADALLCMGAAFTLAAGVSRVTGKRTVGFMGDSTFFHSGMPALLNALKENANMVAVILDNQVTAMTGFQESPSVQIVEGKPRRDVSIEAMIRGLGAPDVVTINPHDLPIAIAAFERARDSESVSVIIAEEPCPVYLARETGQDQGSVTYTIDHSICQT